eukprot:EG_transcript_652
MGLTLIFVAVLAVSVLATSLAAWGITYGVSSSRVSTMAAEFSRLGLGLLQLFDTFVSGLLQSNSDLVNNILALERQSGDMRMQQTRAQVLRIIGTLVNYTTNATGQSQVQMNAVVDTFAGLMGTVFADFKGVTMTCAADLRSELAGKISTFINNYVTIRANVLQRFQSLHNLGLINLSRAYDDPITADDCLLLGLVCDSAREFGADGSMYLTTAGGRVIYCYLSNTAYITQLVVNGSQYTEYRQTWPALMSNNRQQCLTTKPTPVVVSQGCSQPQNCRCGADERCAPWYTPYRNYSAPGSSASGVLVSEPFIGKLGFLQLTISYPIVNESAPFPSLLAATATNFLFVGAQMLLQSYPVPAGSFVANLINDTNLTQFGAIARKCAANETAPGDRSIPLWSSLRSCDPYLREVATWLSQNRANVTAQTRVTLSGVVWDIFPSFQLALVYFTVVGAKDEDTYRSIDTSASSASAQLTAVRAQQSGQVAASGTAAQAYMAAIQAENIREVQTMEASFEAQLIAMENTSRTELAASQQSSTAEVVHLMDSQTQQVDALKAKQLDAMATATGWILGVVFGILLGVLLLGSWGTVRITRSLNNIIGLMEDVADMRVENLEVRQRSQVKEVARIEMAFQVLVVRLAEYKSFMPASLFHQGSGLQPDAPGNVPLPPGPAVPSARARDYEEDDGSGTSGTEGDFRRSSSNMVPGVPSSPAHGSVKCISSKSSDMGVARSPTRKPWGRHVTVLAVNATRFREVMPTMSDGAVRSAFSHYVSSIHEVVAKERGNVDCVVGDQVLVTFNAHISCPDPAGAASTAAMNLQSQLLSQTKFRMGFQMGISCGQAYAGAVGYSKFKTMVTIGDPMKVAALLSHVPDFETGAVITDASVEERLRYSFLFRPVEVVRFPLLVAGTKTPSNTSRIFVLQKKRNLKEDEWMYQLDSSPESDWGRVFGRVENAQTLQEMQLALVEYLAAHPQDPIAVRLRGRLPLWLPGLGVQL